MRNLKKFLALVMAMVMAFSLMLTVNAANPVKTFDDADQITEQFVEAADVLTGMKVFQGDERGFAPSATITRAEVAALIYRLATGDVDDVRAGLYANYGNFTDVNEGDWYAGYVGYCANAGYIKGTSPTTFNPYGKVTGYEVLAMILRAIGYDKNNEFVGATWQTNVSALATQLHILENIKTTDYGNTLHLASRRDVVADLLFQAVAYVPMVTYTLAFGYQDTGMTGGVTGSVKNPTLGYYIFGLWNNRYDNKDEFGVVLGNQETGENGTVIGYSGTSGDTATTIYGEAKVKPVDFSKYTYQQAYYKTDLVGADTGTAVSGNITLGYNLKFDLGTGVDLVGHQVDIWYNQKNLGSKGYETYAYFDEATLAEVVKVAHGTHAVGDETAITNMRTEVAQNVTLYSAMKAAGFSVNKTTTSAYLNNSYGKFSLDKWSDFDSANDIHYSTATINSTTNSITRGPVDVKSEESPEHLYMVVSNSSSKAPDAVISLNIQTSNLTGVDNVNTIKTVTVPFATGGSDVIYGNPDWAYIAADNVLTGTANADANVKGGTLEQKQLVGNSAKTLGAKEIGLHITGTKAYTPERTVAGSVGGSSTSFDTNWFKLTPVTQTKDGVVVAYNNSTVTLSDGTVLEKSIVYDTVVTGTIPQVTLDSYGNDLYEHTNYRFYLNDAGKFVGAERIHGSEFIYGTYVDYSQELNSSAFKYFLTGVKLDGTTTTVPVTSLGWSNTQRPVDITSTSRLGVPFRDGGNVNNITQGIGTGVYRGFSYGSDIANWTFAGLNDIGVVAGANNTSTSGTTPLVVDSGAEATGNTAPVTNADMPIVTFDGYEGTGGAFPSSEDRPSTATDTTTDSIIIGSREVALGATYAGHLDMDGTGSGNYDLLYFTENTKFILVSGYGTDSLKTEVYDGISELRGSSSQVQINLQYTVDNTVSVASQGALNTGKVKLANVAKDVKMSDMTYFTQSPFVYAQNQVLSRQADVIILPAVAVTRTNASNIRYVGNATPTMTNSNAVLGNTATRFTMYNDGVAEQVWIDGLVDFTQSVNTFEGDTTRNSATLVAYGNAGAINSGSPRYHDHFWNLIDTGRTANDGQPIYRVTPVLAVGSALVDASPATAQNTYVASTYSAQTGSFTTNATITGTTAVTRMLNVSSATITNLNADNPNPTWPGITDLATLNEAGSLGIYQSPQYGGTQPLKVSFLLAGNSGTNQLTVTQIYVCYEQ